MTRWDRHRRRRVPGSEWPAVIAMVPIGIAVIGTSYVLRGMRWLSRKLNAAEGDALAEWNLAVRGLASNAEIDALPEEDPHAH